MSTKVFIKPRRARPFWFGDPWVFDGSIDRVKGRRHLEDGDVVEVCDHEGHTIGSGFYNGRSSIRVRMLTSGREPVDEKLVRDRVSRAVAMRRDLLRLQEGATAYRLIHAEGDGLPGLVVDRMGDFLVMQMDTMGIRRFRDVIVDVLAREVSPSGIYERVSRIAREQEGIEAEEGVAWGEEPPGSILVEENGVRFRANILEGQKTGFFTDQRENRRELCRYAAGRRVLDCFSYTGGFGLTLKKLGGAESVVAVDSSAPALELLEANVLENGLDGVEAVQANVLRFLDKLGRGGEHPHDLVILDPPKFVPRRADLRRGLKLYRELNTKALRCLEDGGLLATCSCSQAVSPEVFLRTIAESAGEVGCRLRLLFVGRQGADHPVMVPHEASAYLKFYLFLVTRPKEEV